MEYGEGGTGEEGLKISSGDIPLVPAGIRYAAGAEMDGSDESAGIVCGCRYGRGSARLL